MTLITLIKIAEQRVMMYGPAWQTVLPAFCPFKAFNTQSHWAAPETGIYHEPRPSDEAVTLHIPALTNSATMWLNAKQNTTVWKHQERIHKTPIF